MRIIPQRISFVYACLLIYCFNNKTDCYNFSSQNWRNNDIQKVNSIFRGKKHSIKIRYFSSYVELYNAFSFFNNILDFLCIRIVSYLCVCLNLIIRNLFLESIQFNLYLINSIKIINICWEFIKLLGYSIIWIHEFKIILFRN